MKRIFLAATALLALTQSANASVLAKYLTFDGPVHHTLNIFGVPEIGGGEDRIIDESLATFDDRGTTGLNAGDVIYGMISISDVDASGTPNISIGSADQLAIVFSVKLATPAVGSSYDFDVVPVGSSLDLFDLRNLLAPSVTAVAGLNDSSVFVVLGNGAGENPITNPSPLQLPHVTGTADILLLNALTGWDWELTGGILSGDFFQLDLLTGGGDFAKEVGGFSRQSSVADLSGPLNSVDVQRFDGSITTHDLTLPTGNIQAQTTGTAWVFTDNSTFVVNPNPIPEPTSALVWVFAAIMATAASARRARS
jgi:hypothetical protein